MKSFQYVTFLVILNIWSRKVSACYYSIEALRDQLRAKYEDQETPEQPVIPPKLGHYLTSLPSFEILSYPSRGQRYIVIEHNPEQFKNLRLSTQLENIYAESLMSEAPFHPLKTNSLSSASFLRTQDKKFFIKTMKERDMKLWIKKNFSQAYFSHFQASEETFLSAYMGVYTIYDTLFRAKKHFVIMENVLMGCPTREVSYDLKGNEFGRREHNPKKTQLDLNFGNHSIPTISNHQTAGIQEALNRDATFLAQWNIMDYSLMVGFETNSTSSSKCSAPDKSLRNYCLQDEEDTKVCLGMIDFLRRYDKWMQMVDTSLVIPAGLVQQTHTPVSPSKYRQQFINTIFPKFQSIQESTTSENEKVQQ